MLGVIFSSDFLPSVFDGMSTRFSIFKVLRMCKVQYLFSIAVLWSSSRSLQRSNPLGSFCMMMGFLCTAAWFVVTMMPKTAIVIGSAALNTTIIALRIDSDTQILYEINYT